MAETAGRPPAGVHPDGDVEALLLQEGLVDEAEIRRARRIASHLKHPKPISEILVELGKLARKDHERILRLHRSRLSVAEILLEDGVLDAEGFDRYEQGRRESPEKSERELLVGSGLVSEEQFLQALCAKHGIPFVVPEVPLVDTELLGRTSFRYLKRHKVLPVRREPEGLVVIMADPLDLRTRQELERIYEAKVRPWGATAKRIEEALSTLERIRDRGESQEANVLQYREIVQAVEDDDTVEGAVRLVDYLLCRAIALKASDLHIEPLPQKVRVRVRVDGVLRPLTDFPLDFAARLVSRIKVLAGMDIAERRHHQDGRIFVKVEGREVDLRVSSYASVYGETLVVRILDRHSGLIPLDSLGFEPRILSLLQDVVLRDTSGLVLVTGPTGTGKTTTLYSFLDYVNDDTVKAISCEDPVEYILEGVTQCSVNEKTGPTFADSLRAMVRQDPDVIVVGEIRDDTTASLAVQAALTGHKVMSTFHTEDAVGAVVRLLEMGVEPFLASSTLSCVVAQRLLRRLCPECRKPGRPSRKDMRYLQVTPEDFQGLDLLQPAGCASCEGAGYAGRLAIHEVLVPDDDFRDAILQRAPSKELRRLARRLPAFLTLQEDGLLKAASGSTSLAEVVAHAPRDTAARPVSVLREIAGLRRWTG